MLKCHHCLRSHIRALISIHTPLSQLSSRAFTTSAVAYIRSNPPAEQKPRHGNQWGLPRDKYNDYSGKYARRPTMEEFQMAPLQHDTRDPRQVATWVNKYLMMGDVQKAYQVVVNFTPKVDTVVSWNALIKHAMEAHQVPVALRYYNDMKKRKVRPDAYTYSHLLSGFASQPKALPIYVKEALKIFQHLKTKNPSVKPTVVHTNALLSVCMRVGDMNTAWSILSKLPEYGPKAADPTTYTIFFRALRDGDEDSLADAKRAWSGILARWYNGDFEVDEYLANSYLDIFLHGPTPSSWREVFKVASEVYELPDFLNPVNPNEPTDSLGMQHIVNKSRPDSRPRPDDFTLGILLKAAEKLQRMDVAQKYWDELVTKYCEPSTVSTQRYLRCTSICHAGGAAADILERPPARLQLSEWNYVMGLKACVTSGGSFESYRNAERILDTAEKGGHVGVLLLRSFLLVAMTTTNTALIKRALTRIERFLRPPQLAQCQRVSAEELPKDKTNATEIGNKFVFCLKKAIFWDNLKYGRFEESKWMDKFREVKASMKAWGKGTDGVSEMAEANEVERATQAKREVAAIVAAASERPVESVSEKEQRRRLGKVIVGLRHFTPRQRQRFLNSL